MCGGFSEADRERLLESNCCSASVKLLLQTLLFQNMLHNLPDTGAFPTIPYDTNCDATKAGIGE